MSGWLPAQVRVWAARVSRGERVAGHRERDTDLNTRPTTRPFGIPTIVDMTDAAISLRAPRREDVVGVLLIIALVVIGTSQIEAEGGERSADWLAFVCGVGSAASLLWWRRGAVVVAAVVSVAISVYLARSYPGGPALLPGPLSMLALGYVAPRKTAWIGVAGLLIASAIGRAIADQSIWLHIILFLGWASAAVLAGQAIGARGERAVAERERVAHAHDQALANERLRIAQDLHDSVAHAMATINVQSGVAAHLVERKPEQAAVALEAIRTASRDALDELGAILGVLRESGSAAPLAPMSGLGDVGSLVERARADGVAVTLEEAGDRSPVTPIAGTAAYRVVQEALTNTRRHAGSGVTVNVVVTVGERGALHVVVSDDGGQRAPLAGRASATAGGFGLIGMRERVESSGGSLVVGPTPPSGFRVEAVWPERA